MCMLSGLKLNSSYESRDTLHLVKVIVYCRIKKTKKNLQNDLFRTFFR